ncbi:hypothetical protein [Coleofasciculus sp. F4-SAH-05]|uniref:hypothetical protein n=1 Tax=Coleofasciculus TaxID=669368 RepID=UPI0032F35BBB
MIRPGQCSIIALLYIGFDASLLRMKYLFIREAGEAGEDGEAGGAGGAGEAGGDGQDNGSDVKNAVS